MGFTVEMGITNSSLECFNIATSIPEHTRMRFTRMLTWLTWQPDRPEHDLDGNEVLEYGSRCGYFYGCQLQLCLDCDLEVELHCTRTLPY